LLFSLDFNLRENLIELLLSSRLIDLDIIFCVSIITKPKPNSTADKTKKKNVKDRILILSYKKPMYKARRYSVIHKNSAVSNKCIAVFIFITILVNIKKNKNIIKFISPNNIMYI